MLERIGMTKSEFARQMGIRKQNVKALFRSKSDKTKVQYCITAIDTGKIKQEAE